LASDKRFSCFAEELHPQAGAGQVEESEVDMPMTLNCNTTEVGSRPFITPMPIHSIAGATVHLASELVSFDGILMKKQGRCLSFVSFHVFS
jgi:hypothetical protein